MNSFQVAPDEPFTLADIDPGDTHGLDEGACERLLGEHKQRMAECQNVLFAEGRRALLIVLQSMDTGGKDPIIRDVLSAMNPQACRVTQFKRASPEEESYDRFWRFHQGVPAKGEVGAFNRAYFDDLIRQDAHGDIDAQELARHYEHINHFEQLLADNDVRVVKLFLHISKAEQRVRLQERIDNPARHWELSESDFTERRYWDGYMRAYETAIRYTNTPEAPWYVIPSDRKWFRDAAAAALIANILEDMDPQFPPATVDLANIEWH